MRRRISILTVGFIAILTIGFNVTPVKASGNGNEVDTTIGVKSSGTVLTGKAVRAIINWHVLSSTGLRATSASFQAECTAGQTATGVGESESYQSSHGYWPEGSAGSSCCVLRADINHNGAGPDIADLVYLVSYMFQNGPTPPCEEPVGSGYCPEADVDGNLVGPDISDLVYLVSFMFQNGPAPVPCP